MHFRAREPCHPKMTRSMTDGMDRLPGGSPMQLKRVTREARNMCDASRGVVASESIGRRAFAPFPPSLVSILMGIFRFQLLPAQGGGRRHTCCCRLSAQASEMETGYVPLTTVRCACHVFAVGSDPSCRLRRSALHHHSLPCGPYWEGSTNSTWPGKGKRRRHACWSFSAGIMWVLS